MTATADIGLTGLAVMGQNLAPNMADHGFAAAVYNSTTSRTEAFMKGGESGGLRTIPLHFAYEEEFGQIPEAYETSLRDVIQGDQALFVHSDEVEESWRLFTPIVEADLPIHDYPAGSWGPTEASTLLDGGEWAVGPPHNRR